MFQRTLFALAMVLGFSQATQAQTAVGPRGPVGPQASVTCTGIPLAAGANIQNAVNSKPAGTTFCLAAGTYTNQRVTPKSGDSFMVYRPQFVGHRIQPYAALATGWSCF
jgi:hypothetical protein